MSSFFISPNSIKGKIALICGAEAHHILDVMRLKENDPIAAFDGSGKLYYGKIVAITYRQTNLLTADNYNKQANLLKEDSYNKQVSLQIERIVKVRPGARVQMALVCALPKKHKMDYIVEKATELGVKMIIPAETARTIVRLSSDKKLKRLERWQRIATEAAKQCSRTTVPEIKPICSWHEALADLGGFDLKLLFCLSNKALPIKKILSMHKKAKHIAVCIGPEGDFVQEEIVAASEAGCLISSLGKNVLKVDTAAVSALAMVNYELS